jgi:hypothetical protein
MRSKLSREQRVCQQSLFNQNFAILAEEDWSECLSSAGHAAELLQARRETASGDNPRPCPPICAVRSSVAQGHDGGP